MIPTTHVVLKKQYWPRDLKTKHKESLTEKKIMEDFWPGLKNRKS